MRAKITGLALAAGLWGMIGTATASDATPPVPVVQTAPPGGGQILFTGHTACNSCASSHGAANILIGAGCANPIGCGSFASERTFHFGSCKQFFSPGNDCSLCGKRKPFEYPVFGPGGLGDHTPCTYGSYLNR